MTCTENGGINWEGDVNASDNNQFGNDTPAGPDTAQKPQTVGEAVTGNHSAMALFPSCCGSSGG